MTVPRAATLAFFAVALLGLGACTVGNKPQVAVIAPGPDAREALIAERKHSILQQLSMCESGVGGPGERPIYGGRGAYHGPFQFSVRTFITYTARRDGTQLTVKEATVDVQDWDKAAGVASFMVFDLEESWHWPLCSRKLGIPAHVKAIKEL